MIITCIDKAFNKIDKKRFVLCIYIINSKFKNALVVMLFISKCSIQQFICSRVCARANSKRMECFVIERRESK